MPLFESAQRQLSQAIAALSRAISLKSYRRLGLNFFILAANLLVIVLYFTLAQAKIIIIPRSEILAKEVSYSLENTGQILEKEVKLELPLAVPDSVFQTIEAEGALVIYNTTSNKEQTLVENTQFVNGEGEIIRTRRRVDLSPGESLTVPAYSPEPGKDVLPGRYQVLKLPYLKDKIYGEAAEKFASRERQVKIVSPEFYGTIFDRTIFAMQARAGEEWAAEGWQFDDIRGVDIVLDKMERDAEIGDTGKDFLTVKAGGAARLAIFDRETALAAAKSEFSRSLPKTKVLAEFLEDEAEFVPVIEEKLVLVKIKGRVADKIDSGQINNKELAGKNGDEIRQYLGERFPGADVAVKFSPFWVKSAPRLEKHLEIEIK